MKIGNREFDTHNQTYIMGILNVTPDSFSDGGCFNNIDSALKHVEKMVEEGADIIDVGGESTRPGYVQISPEEEIERVVPVIERIHAEFDVPISLDTYKSKVADAGIKAGAAMINDIWGLKYEEEMAQIIAKSGVACSLMHNRAKAVYDCFLMDVISDLDQTLQIASRAGIPNERIILDPGIGFGKTYENNLQMLHNLEELHCFGAPLLLGASRKSVIGLALNLPVEEREEGTIVTTTLAVMKHYSFVRVHDVQANKRAVQMAQVIRDAKA